MNPKDLAEAAVAWYNAVDALESLRLTSIIAGYVQAMNKDCPELKTIPVTYLLTIMCYGAVLGRTLETTSWEVGEDKTTRIPLEIQAGLADIDLEV